MSYKILKTWDIKTLEEQVNKYLDQGFMPVGGLVFDNAAVIQALYRSHLDDMKWQVRNTIQ